MFHIERPNRADTPVCEALFYPRTKADAEVELLSGDSVKLDEQYVALPEYAQPIVVSIASLLAESLTDPTEIDDRSAAAFRKYYHVEKGV